MILNQINRKVCIVGSGFCGFAAYKKLKEENIELLVVEGGDIETPKSQKDQSFYKIFQNPIIKFRENLNLKSRLDPSFNDRKYTLGGSSECWTGWIKPFEQSTYKNSFNTNPNQIWGDLNLEKYNNEVLNLLNSPISEFDPNIISKELNYSLPKLSNGLSYTTYAWASEPLRIKNFWKERLIRDNNFNKINKYNDVIVGYKLLDYKKNKNKIETLIFRNKNNDEIIVKADYFIFCMGGIENARFAKRIFKNSNIKNKDKEIIGNFQEHPHFYNIAYFNKGAKSLPNLLTKGKIISDKSNYFSKNGRVKIAIKAWDGPGTPKVTFDIYKTSGKTLFYSFQNIIRSNLKRTLLPNSDYWITMRCEQTPNNNSKLKFTSNKNYLNWNVKDSDFIFYSNYLKKLGSFLIANGYAEEFNLSYNSHNNFAIPPQIYGGCHHMGTVPFLQNQALINDKFRLSIFDNSFIVGSSSFPTSGFENPTHAAMATALVACEDLIRQIKE